MQELQGVIDNIVFQSEDNQFSVFRVKTDHEGKVSVVYRGPAPFLGESVELSGSWGEHAKFGRQFRAEVCQAIKPSTTDGVERFLASGAVRGIGKTMAARIVEHFGSDTLDVLSLSPHRLTEISGIGRKKAEAIGMSYAELSDMRELMVYLESHGVSANYAPKLQAQYGATAMKRIQENPYSLASDITGIGFRTADKIALATGMDGACEERIKAGLEYALNQAASAGHTCVPEELLLRETVRLLQVSSSVVNDVFQKFLAEDMLRTEEVGGLRLIYPEYLYQAEVQTSKRLLKLRDLADALEKVNVDKIIGQWESEAGIVLAEAQKEAIHASLKYGVFVLTGGPGTGKTTVARIIGDVLYQKQVISRSDVIEVSRADLVAEYVGQTASKTREVLKSALGGILFIDEAYTLSNGGENDFEREAIDEILKFMEDNRDDIMIIFAGYPKEMRKFLKMNSGLKSRIPNVFDFEDYTADEVVQIGLFDLSKRQYILENEDTYSEVVKDSYESTNDHSNGRWIRNVNEKLIAIQAERLASSPNDMNDIDVLKTITEEDLLKFKG